MLANNSKFRVLLLMLELSVAIVALEAAAAKAKMENPWVTGMRNLLEDCPVKTAKVEKESLTPSIKFVKTLADCARKRAVMAIDDILDDDVIPIVKGFDLVRYKKVDERFASSWRSNDRNGSVTFSLGKLLKRIHDQHHANNEMHDHGKNWRENLSTRLARVLKTHVIKIDVDRLEPAIPEVTSADNGARTAAGRSLMDDFMEGRGPARRRRRRQMQMMPIVMMAVLLMGSVLIPMGFQFLAVLGGKALLLAKMALMLSSIQGLKKIATNGVNYGLYHSPVPEPWHERSSGPPLDVAYATVGAAAAAAGGGGINGAGSNVGSTLGAHHHSYHHASHPVSSYIDGDAVSSYSLAGHFAKRSAVRPT